MVLLIPPVPRECRVRYPPDLARDAVLASGKIVTALYQCAENGDVVAAHPRHPTLPRGVFRFLCYAWRWPDTGRWAIRHDGWPREVAYPPGFDERLLLTVPQNHTRVHRPRVPWLVVPDGEPGGAGGWRSAPVPKRARLRKPSAQTTARCSRV